MNEETTVEVTQEVEKTTCPSPDIGGWLKKAWEIFAADWLKYCVSVLITFGVGIVTCGILMGPMTVGLYQCVLKKIQGQDYEYGDLFNGVKTQFLPAFLLSLAAGAIPVIIGMLPYIGYLSPLVQLAIAPLLYFSLYKIAVAEKTVEVNELKDLVMGVFNHIQSQYIMFVLWFFILGIITMLGSIACCVGVLATAAIAVIAVTLSYIDTFSTEAVVKETVIVEEHTETVEEPSETPTDEPQV